MRNGNDDLALAQMWYAEVAHTCYVPDEKKAVMRLLEGCVVELRRALVSPFFSTEPAVRAGERLVQAHFLSVAVLERSLTLLDREFPTRVGDTAPPAVAEELADRWSQLRNRFTAGFMAAFVDRVRQQKDDLYGALLAAYKEQGERLLGRCTAGCAAEADGETGCIGLGLVDDDAGQSSNDHACPAVSRKGDR